MAHKIAIIGLGYVGLPLAVGLSHHFEVVGFDISAARIAELKTGHDRTCEVDDDKLASARIAYTDSASALSGCDIFIVTVPTPVDSNNEPDLSLVLSACDFVGQKMAAGAIVVFESTVYPGVTDDICAPALERASGLVCGQDFYIGYSPERINPGDRLHTVDKIVKVVAGQTPAITEKLATIYGAVNGGLVHKATSIKVAEAAKVIENAQRDINIAFMNEISTIFRKMGIATHDVLAAAGTKWNFLPFTPGLVGGHCIGVDPFYLARCAMDLGHNPEIILSGRRINDGMAEQVVSELHSALKQHLKAGQAGRILILGLTFKEDVPDLRNSKVADLVSAFTRRGHLVTVVDPLADKAEAMHEYGIALADQLDTQAPYDLILGAVAHADYKKLDQAFIATLLTKQGIVADLKGIWRSFSWPQGISYWQV